jgi:hypothetical protein
MVSIKKLNLNMLKTTLLFCMALPVVMLSQGWLPVGARSNSMANASVSLSDAWAYHHNPGALAGVDKLSIGVSYENRFLLRELQSQGFVYAQPLKKGVISMGVQSYGFTNYRTLRSGLGYSMKLSEKLMAGVQLNYQSLRLSEVYGSKQTVTAEFGMFFSLTERWSMGMSVFNLGRAKLSDYQDDRFSTLMRLGTNYRFSDKFMVVAEAEKDLDHPLRLKGGMEYAIAKPFFFRCGVSTKPVELTVGFGYKLKNVQLDLGSAYHQQLGWSPHVGLTILGK